MLTIANQKPSKLKSRTDDAWSWQHQFSHKMEKPRKNMDTTQKKEKKDMWQSAEEKSSSIVECARRSRVTPFTPAMRTNMRFWSAFQLAAYVESFSLLCSRWSHKFL